MRALSLFLLFILSLVTGSPLSADEPVGPAGNEEVERIMQEFEGRGALADGSPPLSPQETIDTFQLTDGWRAELVAAEPDVMQPLFMHFDHRGRMWVVQYKQYPFPAGLKIVRYDQHLRAVFDRVPQPPPLGTPGKDVITVFEDTDGDGRYDTHKDVITGLNIASAVVTQPDGIWVLNPPYLLFYPDADGDDVPDSDPQVHLSGFGLEDTHSVANSLRWGPDGWLYAANGSTTTGNVSSEVTKNVQFEGQNIWRYHPQTKVFEIYAEGGGNTFSTEIDMQGRVFSGTNHGSTRGMYYPQGSYSTKNWGKHGPLTNPYAFGYFEHMSHEGDSDRFAQTFVIYEGGWDLDRSESREAQGSQPLSLDKRHIIAANALHNRVWLSELTRETSTYRTKDEPPIVETDHRWFRPVDLKVGPDGSVYVADWYDSRLTHVDPRDNWHKSSGRVYRLLPPGAPEAPSGKLNVDFTKLTDAELIHRFADKNKWQRQTAVRILGRRLHRVRNDESMERLRTLAVDDTDRSLEALWTLNLAGEFSDELALTTLAHPDEHVRRWTIRLIGDRRSCNQSLCTAIVTQAEHEPDIQVRVQLAATAKRLPATTGLGIVKALLTRHDDSSDMHQPLMLWWAIEAHCGDSPDAVLDLFADTDLWKQPIVEQVILERLMQRFALEGTPESYQACAKLLEINRGVNTPRSPEHTSKLMSGLLAAFEGREIEGLPEELVTAVEQAQKGIGESEIALGVRLGKAQAVQSAIKVIGDESSDTPTRLAYIKLMGQVDQPQSVSTLLSVLSRTSSPAVKRAAMTSLMSYEDPRIGQTICNLYNSRLPAEHNLRETAHRVLASRAVWAKQFLAEIDAWRIKANSVSLDVVQQMRLHDDAEINRLIEKHWGKLRQTSAEKQATVRRLKRLLTDETASPDAVLGKAVFKKSCAVCHMLFDEGGKAGPNLTGYERTNLDFMLLAMVDPSAAIREEYTNYLIVTDDGRTLTGLIEQQTPNIVTLRGANGQATTIDRADIDVLQAQSTSLMPDGLLDKLTDAELRNLMSYLTRRVPVRVDASTSDSSFGSEDAPVADVP